MNARHRAAPAATSNPRPALAWVRQGGPVAIGALLLVCCVDLLRGAEIFQCEVDGVKTFVDSPRACPGAVATRRGPDGQRAATAEPGAANVAPAQRASPGRARPAVTAPSAPVATPCAQVAKNDSAALRQCLRDERRREVRRIASARLTALSRAVAEFARAPTVADGLIAIDNTGKPPPWCEAFFNDVIALRNVEVVDDEESAGPRWINAPDADGRRIPRAAEILDPDFREWSASGGPVAQGYVTLRWRATNLVVLRTMTACVEIDAGKAKCNAQRYPFVQVHDADFPQACKASFVGRPYWAHWKNSMNRIELEVPAAPIR